MPLFGLETVVFVDDIEDPNEHLLGLALIRAMRAPGNGVSFDEVAVVLIEAIKSEGWIHCEERDQAERDLSAAAIENDELHKANTEYEADIIKLNKQIAVLVSQLGSGITSTGTGISVSPSTPWVTYTSSSSSAIPAAQVAAEYLKHRRHSGI